MTAGRFKNRVALVTGAGSGMGRACAIRLAREGARVVVNDTNERGAHETARRIRSAGGRSLIALGDISLPTDVEQLINRTIRTFTRLDILINNAGILRSTPFEHISVEEWELVMRVNVTGVFLCSQAALPMMKRRRYGRIINLSSSAGRSTSTLGGAHYTSSKAAVLGLTRHLAKETASYGITANAVCPGLIDTEMVRHTCSAARIRRYIHSFPIHRLGRPEEVAALIVFLASEDAGYLTGATFDINGGDLMI